MNSTLTDPRIYVACLASYNAGTLHGVWIDCYAKDEDDIGQEVAAMLRKSPHPNVTVECPECEGECCEHCNDSGEVPSAEEWAIHDYECFGPVKLSEWEDFERIAALVEVFEELEDEAEAFAIWYGNGSHDESDPSSWVDAFRDVYRGCYESEADYAYEWHNDVGDLASVPESLSFHIDWKGVARDMPVWSERGSEGVHIFDR